MGRGKGGRGDGERGLGWVEDRAGNGEVVRGECLHWGWRWGRALRVDVDVLLFGSRRWSVVQMNNDAFGADSTI